jgi:ATP-binding cassette subfamily F protein 3
VVLRGLGFGDELLRLPTRQLSGGWRMRAALAKALFVQPDVLMLDEPTNHLDLQAVGWLEAELQRMDGLDTIVLVVSHDRAFLAAVATDIVEFVAQSLKQWPMGFDDYIEAKQMKATKQAHQIESLERRRNAAIEQANRMEKAAAGKKRGKKGDEKKSKQVASRRKAVERMGFDRTEDGAKWKVSEMGSKNGSLAQAFGKQTNAMTAQQLARAAVGIFSGGGGGETPFRVKFKRPTTLSQPNLPVLQLREVGFAWPAAEEDGGGGGGGGGGPAASAAGGPLLLNEVTLSLHGGDRLALLGANGQGKSTLVELMRGAVSPLSGEVIRGHGVTCAHYSQHSAESLPPQLSPLQYHLHVINYHDQNSGLAEISLRFGEPVRLMNDDAEQVDGRAVPLRLRGGAAERAGLVQHQR